MLRELRGAVLIVAVAVAAVAAVPLLPSCGESYEPPCRVTALRVVADEAMTAGHIGAVGIERRDDAVVLSWARADARQLGDAGAADAGDAGDAGAGADAGADAGAALGPSSFKAAAMSVLVVAADGAPLLTHTFAPPAALAARRGSTGKSGATFTGDGALFHWIETTSTTEPDGTPTGTASLKLQRVGLDGSEGALISDPELSCTHCAIDATFATVGATTAAIVRRAADASSAGTTAASASGAARLVAFDAEGRKIAAIDLQAEPAAPARDGGSGLSQGNAASAALQTPAALYARDGLFFARIGRVVDVVDPALTRRAGPFALVTSGTEIDLDLASGDLALAWIGGSAGSGAADPASLSAVGDAPDLYFEGRTGSGAPGTSPHRISSSFGALGVRRSGGRTAVIHSTGDAEWLVLVDGSGKKIGGDVQLQAGQGATLDETRALLGYATSAASSAIATTSDARSRLLVASGTDRFVVWSSVNQVLREEVLCGP